MRTDIGSEATFSVVADRTTSDPTDLSDAELSAACQTLDDALTDLIASDDLQILDDPGLLRSAELLAGDFADDEVAIEVELFLVNGTTEWADIDDGLIAAGASPADRELGRAYFDARGIAPSEGVAESFVVYLVGKKRNQVQIVRRSVYPIPRVDTRRPRIVEILRVDGSTIGAKDGACAGDRE